MEKGGCAPATSSLHGIGQHARMRASKGNRNRLDGRVLCSCMFRPGKSNYKITGIEANPRAGGTTHGTKAQWCRIYARRRFQRWIRTKQKHAARSFTLDSKSARNIQNVTTPTIAQQLMHICCRSPYIQQLQQYRRPNQARCCARDGKTTYCTAKPLTTRSSINPTRHR